MADFRQVDVRLISGKSLYRGGPNDRLYCVVEAGTGVPPSVEGVEDGPPYTVRRTFRKVSATVDPVWNDALRITFHDPSPKPVLLFRVYVEHHSNPPTPSPTDAIPDTDHVTTGQAPSPSTCEEIFVVGEARLELDPRGCLIVGVPLLFVDYRVELSERAFVSVGDLIRGSELLPDLPSWSELEAQSEVGWGAAGSANASANASAGGGGDGDGGEGSGDEGDEDGDGKDGDPSPQSPQKSKSQPKIVRLPSLTFSVTPLNFGQPHPAPSPPPAAGTADSASSSSSLSLGPTSSAPVAGSPFVRSASSIPPKPMSMSVSISRVNSEPQIDKKGEGRSKARTMAPSTRPLHHGSVSMIDVTAGLGTATGSTSASAGTPSSGSLRGRKGGRKKPKRRTATFRNFLKFLGGGRKKKGRPRIVIRNAEDANLHWETYMAHLVSCLEQAVEDGSGDLLKESLDVIVDPAKHLSEVIGVTMEDIMQYLLGSIGSFHQRIEETGFDAGASTLRAGQARRILDMIRPTTPQRSASAPAPASGAGAASGAEAEAATDPEGTVSKPREVSRILGLTTAPASAPPTEHATSDDVSAEVDEEIDEEEGEVAMARASEQDRAGEKAPGEEDDDEDMLFGEESLALRAPPVRPRVDARPSSSPSRDSDSASATSGSGVRGQRIELEDGTFLGRFEGSLVPLNPDGTGPEVPDGEGLMLMPSGEVQYVGGYNHGKRQGGGTLEHLLDDGVVLNCRRWSADLPTGVCRVVYRDGNEYNGRLRVQDSAMERLHDVRVDDFLRHGKGKLISSTRGYFYFGNFANNMRSGFGVCDYFEKGERYVGNWANDKYEGDGCYCYVDGSVYNGFFKEGRRFRDGTYHLSNGYLIKGRWTSQNRIEKISLHEGRYENVSEHLLSLVEAEIKRHALLAKTRSIAPPVDERNKLWRTLFDPKGLVDDLGELGDVWGDWTVGRMRRLIRNEEGTLKPAISFFTDYFCEFYSLRQETVKSHKLLLYAKDDVVSFIEFLTEAVFTALKTFNPASWFNKGARGPGGMLKSLGSVQHFAVAKGVGYMNRMKRGGDPHADLRKKRFIIREVILGSVHHEIFPVLFKLYTDEYREKELFLTQKTNAVLHALKQLSPRKKVEYFASEVALMVPTSEWEELELAALKHLLSSVREDRETHEFGFLECALKCLNLKVALFRDQVGEAEREAVDSFGLPPLPASSAECLITDRLIELETRTKSSRIGLVCVAQASSNDKLLKLLDVLQSASFPIESMRVGAESLALCYDYLQRYLLSEETTAHLVTSDTARSRLEAACLGVESVEMDLTYFNLPSYARYVRTTKSVHKRINSLKAHLRTLVGEDNELLERLEALKKGKRSLIVDRAKKMDHELVSLCRPGEAGGLSFGNIEFLLTRWRSLFRHIMTGYSPDEKRQVDILVREIESVQLELKSIQPSVPASVSDVIDVCHSRLQSILLELRNDARAIIREKTRAELLRQRAGTIKSVLELVFLREQSKVDHCFQLLRNAQSASAGLIQVMTLRKIRAQTIAKTKEVMAAMRSLEKQEPIDRDALGEQERCLIVMQQAFPVLENGSGDVALLAELQLTQTFRTLEMGTKALQLSVESAEAKKQLEVLQATLKVREVQEMMQATADGLESTAIQEKVRAVENGLELRERDNADRIQPFQLIGLGVREEFIPSEDSSGEDPSGAPPPIPYSRSIEKLNELGQKRSIVDKIRILKQLDETIADEMRSYSSTKMFEEDDILPIVLYVFLQSDLNHYAEYNYLHDWMSRGTMMLMRYDIFFKYVENLDPYARGKGGELLSVLGNILSPFKNAIFKAIQARPTKLTWLINLFNYIYCEIGFLAQGRKRLEIRNPKLRETIVRNFELVQMLFVGGSIGFSIVLDLEAENTPVIEFHSVYSPNIYKWAAEEILRDFGEYIE